MSHLRLRVVKGLDGDREPARLYAELSGGNLNGTRRFTVPAGDDAASWHEENLDPGRYLVQVTLPSGLVLAEDIQVPATAPDPVEIAIKAPAPAHQHLAWPQLFGVLDVDFEHEYVETRPEGMRHDDRRTSELPPSFQIYSGTSEFGRFFPVRDGAEVSLGDGRNVVTYRIRTQRDGDRRNTVVQFLPLPLARAEPTQVIQGPMFLSIEGMPGGPQGVALPLPWRSTTDGTPSQLDVVLHRHGWDMNTKVSVAVVVRDAAIPSMLAYLEHGQLPALHALRETYLKTADLLDYEISNPYAAAAGGLILLRTRAYDRLHNWPANLSKHFPWLPDVAILYGTCLLLGIAGQQPGLPETPRWEHGRAAILEGIERGFPLYTESLRLAIDGIRRYQLGYGNDDKIDAALERLRQLAADVDWTQPYTTFSRADFKGTTPTKLPPKSQPILPATQQQRYAQL